LVSSHDWDLRGQKQCKHIATILYCSNSCEKLFIFKLHINLLYNLMWHMEFIHYYKPYMEWHTRHLIYVNLFQQIEESALSNIFLNRLSSLENLLYQRSQSWSSIKHALYLDPFQNICPLCAFIGGIWFIKFVLWIGNLTRQNYLLL
jgi:hypothetical protein